MTIPTDQHTYLAVWREYSSILYAKAIMIFEALNSYFQRQTN